MLNSTNFIFSNELHELQYENSISSVGYNEVWGIYTCIL